MSRDHHCDGLMVIGSHGRSAYAYALEGGYTGSEKEFSRRLAALLSEEITAYVDKDNHRITLRGDLPDGEYTAYYEVNGTSVEIGRLSSGLSGSYTIRWLDYNDTVLRADTVTEGETPSYGATPIRSDDEGYTYTFAGWSPAVVPAVANAEYKATYTKTPKVDNLLDPSGYQQNKRLSVSDGSLKDLTGAVTSNFIPITLDQTLHISGITQLSAADYNAIVFYTANEEKVSATSFAFSGITIANGVYSMTPSALTASNDTIAQFRFSCADIGEGAVVTVS